MRQLSYREIQIQLILDGDFLCLSFSTISPHPHCRAQSMTCSHKNSIHTIFFSHPLNACGSFHWRVFHVICTKNIIMKMSGAEKEQKKTCFFLWYIECRASLLTDWRYFFISFSLHVERNKEWGKLFKYWKIQLTEKKRSEGKIFPRWFTWWISNFNNSRWFRFRMNVGNENKVYFWHNVWFITPVDIQLIK